MIDIERFNVRIGKLEERLQAKLGLRGSSLEKRLAKAGRRLPKRLHKSGQLITEAQTMMRHPKLARLIKADQIDRAFTHLNEHLETIDPADRRKGAILGMLGGMVFNLILLIGALVAVLHWQGLI